MSYFDWVEDRIQAETMEIAVALICQISSQRQSYIRMKKQVDHVIHRHEILFTGMLRKLDLLSKSVNKNEKNRQNMIDDLLCRDLTTIFNYLIQDDNISWGKVITIFAFSTFLASKHSEMADRIAYVTGQYVVKQLTAWIKGHGGWDSMALMEPNYDIDNLNTIYTFYLACIGLSLIGLFLVLR